MLIKAVLTARHTAKVRKVYKTEDGSEEGFTVFWTLPVLVLPVMKVIQNTPSDATDINTANKSRQLRRQQ